MSIFLGVGGAIDPVWAVSFEDDLVMTNVRSFDVKAYDNSFGGYADLGWADDLAFVGAVFERGGVHQSEQCCSGAGIDASDHRVASAGAGGRGL